MSFILDAIAKSEQERQQQQTPDASRLAFPAAVPLRSRSASPYLFAAALLLGGAILVAAWMQSSRPLEAPLAGSGGAGMPTAPQGTSLPPAAVEFRDKPPTDRPQPVSATPMLAESPAATTIARAQPPTAGKTDRASATGSTGEDARGLAALAPAGEIAAEDALEAGPGSAAGASGTDAAAAASSSATAAPRRRVSRLYDLPDDVRRALPSVVFTGHLYSRNPKVSYVFVDGGRQVVAGQQIVDDLVLQEITPTGVVVEFQGYLIEVGVLQNWSLKGSSQ